MAVYGGYQDQRIQHYKTLFASPADIDQQITTAEERNTLINDMELFIKINFDQTEANLYNHKSFADFAGDVAITGLSTAGTLVGSSGLKTTLSAIVTAISGTKVAFNSDVLQNQSVIAIIGQMEKLRSQKILEIETSKGLSIEKYPPSEALLDIIQLYQDGTPVEALQSIITDASTAKSAADQAVQDIKGNYAPDDASTLLRNYWKPNGQLNAANAKALNAFLVQEKMPISISAFLYNAPYASERAKAVSQLGLK